MRCPVCSADDTQVKDSRSSEDGISIRRRRWCGICSFRFTTFEKVQFRELMVIKNNGERKNFDSNKILSSIKMAARKRPVNEDKIEETVNIIVKKLEGIGEGDIQTNLIGELIMIELAKLDQVAYVRFASVYKKFREVEDFDKFIKELKIE